jgi:hypothetical protein
MKYVIHRYAGWVGVTDGKIVTNGVIDFDLTKARDEQLADYRPTRREIKTIIAGYETRHADDQHGFLAKLKGDLV